jgi:dTDP-4-dehydrorhamnose 3,5-epimerase
MWKKSGTSVVFSAGPFVARNLKPTESTPIQQANIGFSQNRGTLRGLHYQVSPHGEAKLVRCTAEPFLMSWWT